MVMNDIQARAFESRANQQYGDRFRKIWVDYANIGKQKASIIVTIFPHGHGQYDMAFSKELKNVSWENIEQLIESQLS